MLRPQFMISWILKLNALITVMGSDSEKRNSSRTWIVDVRDLDGRHVCTGSLVSHVYVFAACSCVMRVDPKTKQKEKLQRRVVMNFQGAEQERRSANHFPHLLCEPVGKSGRPVHNYGVTLVDRPFDVPEHDVLRMTADGRAAEAAMRRVFDGAAECESIGWTTERRNGTESVN